MDWGKFDQLLKKREAAMFYDMTEREIKAYQRRKAQHELECVERRKQFEAKWKAEDELFFLKHGITRDEVLYGKKPEVPPVVIPVADTVVVEAEIKPVVVEAVVVEAALSPNEVVEIPVPPIDVVHVDNIQLEELSCPTMAEVVPKDEAVVDIHVLNDVDSNDMHFMEVEPIGEELNSEEYPLGVEIESYPMSDLVAMNVEEVEQSDFLSLSDCSSPISSTLQVLHDPTLESDLGLLDTPHAAPLLCTDVLFPVSICGKPQHSFDDPYLEHVAVTLDWRFTISIAASPGFIHTYIKPRDSSYVPLVKHSAVASYDADARLFIRILFDPGISLEFILGSHDVVHDGALFYDILLIRGRILSNREGMM